MERHLAEPIDTDLLVWIARGMMNWKKAEREDSPNLHDPPIKKILFPPTFTKKKRLNNRYREGTCFQWCENYPSLQALGCENIKNWAAAAVDCDETIVDTTVLKNSGDIWQNATQYISKKRRSKQTE